MGLSADENNKDDGNSLLGPEFGSWKFWLGMLETDEKWRAALQGDKKALKLAGRKLESVSWTECQVQETVGAKSGYLGSDYGAQAEQIKYQLAIYKQLVGFTWTAERETADAEFTIEMNTDHGFPVEKLKEDEVTLDKTDSQPFSVNAKNEALAKVIDNLKSVMTQVSLDTK